MDVNTIFEKGNHVYIQEGVYVQTSYFAKEEQGLVAGTLIIAEESYGNLIVWKADDAPQSAGNSPKEVGGWAVVNSDVCKFQNGADNVDMFGGKGRTRSLIVDIRELSSYRLQEAGRCITIMMKDGSSNPAMWFQGDAAESFLEALKKYLKVKKSKKERDLYILTDPKVEALDRSFAELDLFENRTPFVRGFLRELRQDPYAATMTGFSKLYEVLYNGIQPQTPEARLVETEAAELLLRSLSSVDSAVQEDDYELVTTFRLAPAPEVIRSDPVDELVWCEHLEDDGRVLDVDVLKEKIFKGGIVPELRKDIWKFLLGYYPWNYTFAQRATLRKNREESYFRMKKQWKTIDHEQEKRFSSFSQRKCLVEKDVARTDRTLSFYAGEGNKNIAKLNDILMTYCMYNFDLGYVQGMSDLLSPILYVMESENDAFWCFSGFMERVCGNFELNQDSMRSQLDKLHTLLSLVNPAFCSYAESNDSGNLFFCFRWLLIWFKREFSFFDIQRVWEVLWTDLPCSNFHLLLCLALMDNEHITIMENGYDLTGILKHINEMSGKININRTLEKAEAIYHQLTTSENLPSSVKQILNLSSDHQLCNTKPKEVKEDDTSSIEVLPDELDDGRFDTAMSLNFM